jgi:beta-lactamase regulating signal transducer with metallopeptidase domain
MINAMINYANAAADHWAAWVIAVSLDSALLLAVIGLAWFAIRTRVAPQVGYALFLLVPLKLLVPVVVTVPAEMARWTPSGQMSSWFRSRHVPERVASQSPIEPRMAVVETESAAGDAPRFAFGSRSQSILPPSRQGASPTEPWSQQPFRVSAAVSDQMTTEVSRLSGSAMFMIAWLVGVLLLFARLAVTQTHFRACLQHILPLDVSTPAIDLRDLCRRAGVTETIRIVELDGIAAPAVWGIARPTVILPRGLSASLTADQLRWVLLHELAHVRRRDLIVVTLQRLVAILHFFNPVIWIANRIIHQLREFACDDLAVALSHASAVESGEAFVRILRHADDRRRGLNGALGVFGLDSRADCFRRVCRLLDTERLIHPAPGAWSLWALILLAVISLPHLRAASDAALVGSQNPVNESAPPGQRNTKPASDKARSEEAQEFALRVVGPDGKPIPQAQVELHTYPHPAIGQVRQGKLVKRESNELLVATDDQGQLVVELAQVPTHFNVYITIPGYGPYWARWSSENHAPIPSRFTAELEAAWSIGGIIVDTAGKPVEGVIVWPSIEFKKRPGENQQMGTGTRLKTDAAGRWQFDSVPVSMSEVHVNINHPSFQPVRRRLTRSEFGIERGRQPLAKLVLDHGLTVTGKVTDEAGQPVAGALVRTKYMNNIREAKTGSDGVYRLVGCEPVATEIVVSAKGWATDMKELSIASDLGPVNFQMKPGGTVRVRVLDENGNPVPKARIFFQQWRRPFYKYYEFDHVSQYADQNGIWVWTEAPLDEFKADICRPDGMQLPLQSLIARPEEYVFRVPGALVVSGKVIDSVTRKPIPAFRVVPGRGDNREPIFWNRRESFTATDGHYRFRQTRGDSVTQIRIEADRYQAAVSRDIKSNEGTIAIDFELKLGKNIAAKVMTPRNLPAAGAKVALGVAGSQISVKNGAIDDMQTYCARETTDEAGSFCFSPQDKNFQLVITHPSGFAHISSAHDWELTRIVHLEPWSTVEGTFRIGKAPAANVAIGLDVARLDSFGRNAPLIFTQHQSTSGPDGRFVFERVIPGRGWIGRRIMLMAGEGAMEVTSSCRIAANFPAGQTVHIDLGGTGRAVVGKLQPPEGFPGKVRWNFATVHVRSDTNADSLSLMATVDRNGKFRIDDAPEGQYSISVRFDQDGAGRLDNHRFSVPPTNEGVSAQPVDLGTLTLQKP